MARGRNPALVAYAHQLDRLFRSVGSPLAGHGMFIARTEARHRIPRGTLAGIFKAETSYATDPNAGRDITSGHNPAGWGPHIQFPSWNAAIAAIGRGLGQNYINQGLRTPQQIGRKYAPSSDGNNPNHWASVVSGVMQELGGPPLPARAGQGGGVPRLQRGGGKIAVYDGKGQRLSKHARGMLNNAFQMAMQGGDTNEAFQYLIQGLHLQSQADQHMIMAPANFEAGAGSSDARGTGYASGRFVGLPIRAPMHFIGTPYSGTHTVGNWESDNAVDIPSPVGTPIYAVADGVIGSQIGSLGSSNPRMAGLRLHLITRGNEFYYAHLSKLLVRAGQRVKKGQLIGYSGSANGTAHLHIGVRNGNPTRLFH